MSSMKTWSVVVMLLLVMLKRAAGEDDIKAQKQRHEEVTFRNKDVFSLLDVATTERQEQVNLMDQIPEEFDLLFKTTVYMEAALLCLILPYGVFHLHCWATLFQKCLTTKQQNSEIHEEEIEMAETERHEETTDSILDVIVFSDAEV